MEDRQRIEYFVGLFDRVRRLATEGNPLQHTDVSVSMPQLTMLEWVDAHSGCQLSEMAEGLRVTTPTVSVGVRRLEETGLIERFSDPGDGRAVRLWLTPKAQTLVQAARRFRMDKMQKLITGLSRDEQDTLRDLLDKALSGAETGSGDTKI